MEVIAIIQARVQSTRLPFKVFLDLNGRSMLFHIIDHVKRFKDVSRIIVATTPAVEDKDISALAISMQCDISIGSNTDVLKRFYEAASAYSCKYIVRVTADNPFTDIDFASLAIDRIRQTDADIFSFSDLPLGVGVEIFKKSALEMAYKYADKDYQREHVSPFMWERSDLFKIVHEPSKFSFGIDDLRLTVDYPEDYFLASRIYNYLYRGSPFSIYEVAHLLKRHPDWLDINKKREQKDLW